MPPRSSRRRAGRVFALMLAMTVVVAGVAAGVGYWLWTSPPRIDPSSVGTTVVTPAGPTATESGSGGSRQGSSAGSSTVDTGAP